MPVAYMPENPTITLSDTGVTYGSISPLANPRTVQLKDHWVGQIIVKGQIVKERHGFKTQTKAHAWAQKRIDSTIADLFA